MLRLVDIHKTYDIGPVTVEVLRGAGLDIMRGDMVSIMGPSGSGKSTLMNIIGLLDRPTRGAYYFNEREVSGLDDSELSTVRNIAIGFVFQSFHLLPQLSAEENVGLPLVYRGMKEPEIRERARAMLDKLDMGERVHHKPKELSGGQQQRVAIARALVGDPAIILADEPTGALDPKTGKEIMQLITRLNAEEDTTIVIITHDPDVARQCKRQTRLIDGVLVEKKRGEPASREAS